MELAVESERFFHRFCTTISMLLYVVARTCVEGRVVRPARATSIRETSAGATCDHSVRSASSSFLHSAFLETLNSKLMLDG